jgi:hypothetical protein
MVRSTFAVVAAAVAAATTGTEPAQGVIWTAVPPAPADGGDRFTNIWDDSAWTTTSRRADITLPSPITPLGAAADGAAGFTGPATAANPLTPVNHPTH